MGCISDSVYFYLFQQLKVATVTIKNNMLCISKGKIYNINHKTKMNQGVAYLDDGTMIVVENGRNYMNETIDVAVTSVIQTNAGRMIFAKPND